MTERFGLFVKEVWKDAEVSFLVTNSLAPLLSHLKAPRCDEEKKIVWDFTELDRIDLETIF